MQLKISDLEQLTEARLLSLGEMELRRLAQVALQDIRELLDRLSQGPGNSSCPPGSVALFNRPPKKKNETSGESEGSRLPSGTPAETSDTPSIVDDDGRPSVDPIPTMAAEENPKQKKKPGRQIGAPGYSRNLTLPVTAQINHRPTTCIVCGDVLLPESFIATGGHYVQTT
jgi:transposase